MRVRHYSIRTEEAYENWARRFLTFHRLKPVKEMGEEEVRKYLEYLAVARKISVSTQRQALNALVFFFAEVLKQPLVFRPIPARARSGVTTFMRPPSRNRSRKLPAKQA